MQLRHITVESQHVIKFFADRGIARKHPKKASAPVKCVHLM
jgi:hypothetical protein